MIALTLTTYCLIAAGVGARLSRENGRHPDRQLPGISIFGLAVFWPVLLSFTIGVKIAGMTE